MAKSLHDIEYAIPADRLWLASAVSQINDFRDVERRLNDLAAPDVVSTHSSKSIDLPVMRIRLGDRKVTWLDNFHELDLHYEGPPVDLTYEECGYERWDAARYRAEIEKCAGYSWRGWSEEELNDPRITRVPVTRESGGIWWNERKVAEKERWLARETSAEWVTRDWGGADLLGNVQDTLAGRDVLWRAPSAFVNHAGPYRPNAERFTLVFGTGTIAERVGLIRKMLVPRV